MTTSVRVALRPAKDFAHRVSPVLATKVMSEIDVDPAEDASGEPGNTVASVSSGQAQSQHLNGTVVHFIRGNLIYAECDPAQYLYLLESGAARGYRITTEGRRQIVSFYVPGDIFGFELGDEHAISVEAITDVKVCMIRRTSIMAVATRDRQIASRLWNALAREQRRDQRHILRLGKPARERVASFLLELAERAPTTGKDGVPMPRQDIADYLGITIETVSRSLTQLKSMAAIAISQTRKITIRDPHVLRRLTSHVE